MADAFLSHLRRIASSKGEPTRLAAAAAASQEALLAGIHYFRVRDHIEQVRRQAQGSLRVLDGGRTPAHLCDSRVWSGPVQAGLRC